MSMLLPSFYIDWIRSMRYGFWGGVDWQMGKLPADLLIGTDGRRYIDGVSSLWCNVHGHRHPAIDRAVERKRIASRISSRRAIPTLPGRFGLEPRSIDVLDERHTEART